MQSHTKSRSLLHLRRSVHALVGVGDVQEEVLLVVLLIKASHGCRGRGDHIVDEEEEGILRPQADSFANEEVELERRIKNVENLFWIQQFKQS